MHRPDASFSGPPFRRLVAERSTGSIPPLSDALFAVIRALDAHQLGPPFRFAGDPPRSIVVTESTISRELTAVREVRQRGLPSIFRLATDEGPSALALYVDFEPTPAGTFDQCWCSIPPSMADRPGAAVSFARLLADFCRGFGGCHGAVDDERLAMLYRGARGTERARAAVPAELRQYVPVPPPSTGNGRRVPALLVPQEFDRCRVPDAVWWVNFWDVAQVDTVGRRTIERAGFAQVLEQPSGALALIATIEPTDPTNPAHVERLSAIIQTLDLRRLQERHVAR